MNVLEDFRMGYENFKGNLDGYEFCGEKIYLPPPRSCVLIMTSPLKQNI